MSRKQKIKHMSSNELKAKLYSHFQKSGSLDNLRTQLRGQLVSELFKIAEPVESDKFPNVSDVEKCLLPLQVCNWLVYDHLSRLDYQYTLSTFVSEAQLPYPEKFLTAGDVLGLLGLKNAADFENISKLYSINNELGFLHSLLLAIIKTMFNVSKKDLPLETSYQYPEAVNSEKMVQNGDKELNQSLMQTKSEADASFINLSQFREMLNKSTLTSDDKKSVEMSFLKEIESFEEENDKEVQKMRHRLLDELDNLHAQKHKMQSELEHMKFELQREHSKLQKEKEMLKEKEVLLEKELRNEFEKKMRNLESEFAKKLHFKDKEVESLKRKLSEQDEKLTYSEVELTSEKENKSVMQQELNDLKNMNKILQDKYSSLLDQSFRLAHRSAKDYIKIIYYTRKNTNLLRKFENMSDYSLVKEELAIKSREVARLQNEIKDLYQKSETERRKYVETVRDLENDLNVKESQLIQAREEISDVRNNFKKEQVLWSKERNKFEHEIREMRDHYDTMLIKLKEKDEEIEDLRQNNHILNYKLTNSFINTAKSESDSLYKRYQRPVNIHKSNPEMLFTNRNMTFQQQPEKDYDSKFKFFSDKKSTYGSLRQEESKVQEKYSTVFSMIPEHNNSVPYSKNYSFLSLSKKDSYSYAFSKPASTTSSFNHDSKGKLSTVTKNPYSLSDIRRMVTTYSLSPSKTNKHTDLQTGVNSFSLSSQAPDISDTRVKDVWTASESIKHYDIHRQYGLSKTYENTSTVSTMQYRSSLNKDCISNSASHFSSKKDESRGVLLNSKEFISEATPNNDNSNKLLEDNDNANSGKNSSKENTVKASSDVNKNMDSTASQNSKDVSEQENESNKNDVVITQGQNDLIDSQQYLHTASKTVEPESNFSIFVNLDDAWRKRSSVASLPSRDDLISETNLEKQAGNSLVPNETVFSDNEHTFDKEFSKTDLENNKLTKNVNDDTGKNNSGATSYLSQNRSKQANDNIEKDSSLYDTSVRSADIHITKDNMAAISSELQIPNKVTKHDVFLDKELPLKEIKQTNNLILEISKEEEKTKKSAEDNGKSSEKTGNTDSLSEQSELHISCGSEAELQKEDSDAW